MCHKRAWRTSNLTPKAYALRRNFQIEPLPKLMSHGRSRVSPLIREGAESGLWGDEITPNIMAGDDFGCLMVLADWWRVEVGAAAVCGQVFPRT